MLRTILSVLSGLITIYVLLICAHIILTWMPGMEDTKLRRGLRNITDPYLRLFRKISFLQIGPIDFSPIVAILALNLFNIVIAQWVRNGSINVFQIIVTIASVLLNSLALIGIIFCVMIVIRLILIWRGQVSHVGSLLDQLLQPLSYRIVSRILPNRGLSYRMQLTIFALLLLLISVILRLLSAWFLLR